MFSSFSRSFAFGRVPAPQATITSASLVLELDALNYTSGNWQDGTANNNDAVLQGTPNIIKPSGNIVTNVRHWESAGANLYIWFDAASKSDVVAIGNFGDITGWSVSVSDGNTSTVTATNPAGYFSISTNEALTGTGTLTFTSPGYNPGPDYFDLVPGEGDYFTIADASVLDSMSEFSIQMWINIDSVNAAGPNMLFSKRSTVNDGYVGFFTTTGWTFRLGTGTGTGLTYASAPTTGVWQQIVATIGSGGSKLYINGSEVASSIYTGNPNNVNTGAALDLFEVNPRPQSGPVKMDGKVGIIKIYNGVLTSAEVTSEFNNYKDRYGL